MRPIKFRTWDSQNKEFSEWTNRDPFFCTTSSEIFFWERTKKDDGSYGGDIILEDLGNRFTLQQYTGLNDYKGKEIYEGDILDIFNHPQPEEVIYCSSETAFGFFAHEDKERQNGRFESLGDYTSPSGYTVIGNIFENPELLDKTKEL